MSDPRKQSDEPLTTEVGPPRPDPEAGRVLNTSVSFAYDPPDARNDQLATAAAGGNKRARLLIWVMIVSWVLVPLGIETFRRLF